MITKEYLEELLSKVSEGLTEKSSIDNLAQLKKDAEALIDENEKLTEKHIELTKAYKESILGIDRKETKEPPKDTAPKLDDDGLPAVSQFLEQMKGNN